MRRLLPVALLAAALVLLAAAPARTRAGTRAHHSMMQVVRRERGAYDAAYRRCYRRYGTISRAPSLLTERADATAALLAPQGDRLAAGRGCAAGQAAAQFARMHPTGGVLGSDD